MTIDDNIRDNEKLQYDINREAAKISALSSGKIDKYEYLTGEEILLPDQRRVIRKLSLHILLFGKTLEKQIKAIEYQGEKQIKALENRVENFFLITFQKSMASLSSKNFLNKESTYETNKIVEMENKLDRNGLIHNAGNKKKNKTYDFQKFKTIRSTGREIYSNDLSLDDALEQKNKIKR